jgi:hypothetical protein
MNTDVKAPAAITVRCWIGETKLDGEDEFRTELADNYAIAVVQSRPAGLGGGLYQLLVEWVSHLTLADAIRVLLEGATYDIFKSGTDAFCIRPFVKAYKKFKERNAYSRVGIDRLRFVFQDISISVEEIPNTDLVVELDRILLAVGRNLETLLSNPTKLFEIYIPVFEDTKSRISCKFRTLISVDETIDIKTISAKDYFGFWGLEYYPDFAKTEVFDVRNEAVIHETFCTEKHYWAEVRSARKRQASGPK